VRNGNLAIAAKRRVGKGIVHGVDASPEMIKRATKKAVRADADVAFTEGVVEASILDRLRMVRRAFSATSIGTATWISATSSTS
jgi:hypothetical protein